jgi:hypothetical protein
MRSSFTRKTSFLAAVAAGLMLMALPAHAGEQVLTSPVSSDVVVATSPSFWVAIGDCTATGVTSGGGLTVAIEGTGKATGAIATRIRCGVVQDGAVVAESVNALPGSAAATAKSDNIALAPYYVCSDVFALFVDGSTAERNNCPS